MVLITKSGNINSIDNVQVKAAKIEQSSSIKSIVSEILSIDEKYIIVYEWAKKFVNRENKKQ